MLTSKGFGASQAPTSDSIMQSYEVIKGTVIDGPVNVGDVVKLNPRSQIAIELVAIGRIRLLPDTTEVPVQETNRAVGIENGISAPQKRGKKNGRN